MGVSHKVLGDPPEGYRIDEPQSMRDLYIHWDDRINVRLIFKDTYNQHGGKYYEKVIPLKRINLYPDKIAIERAIVFFANFGIIDNVARHKLLNQTSRIRR